MPGAEILNFRAAASLAQLGRLDEVRSFVATRLALNPPFSVFRARAAWAGMNDNSAFLASVQLVVAVFRAAGVSEQ